MRLSTAAELAGFALLAYAAYSWNALVGLAVAGVFLLLIGYATEDAIVGVSVLRMLRPLVTLKTKIRSWHKSKGVTT